MNRDNFRFEHDENISHHNYEKGGTIINIITAIIFFGLIAAGVLWVIKQTGQAGQQYGQAVVNTQNKATTFVCQSNMRQIWAIIQMDAMSDDKLPDSFDELVNDVGDSRVFKCPEPNSPTYVYIPGQSLDSPPDNILLYESGPVHAGMCNVLRVSGKIESISPEELQAALEQTKAHLRK